MVKLKTAPRIYVGLAVVAFLITLVVTYSRLATADTIDRPVTQGTIRAEIQLPPVSPDALLTQSVSLNREATGQQVLCLPAANGTIVEGDTEPISREDAGVLLRAFAHDGPNCTGEVSIASADAYRVLFGGPGQPVLLRVSPAP